MKGSVRNPSLRTIEKEAYAWAEQGIDTMEEAVAFIRNQNQRRSRLGQLMQTLQIRGRNLTPGEEKYAQQWLDWGFATDAIALAYERTCLNTGGLSWAYMNKILTRWHQAGLRTGAQVRSGDRKGGNPGERQFDADEQAAIKRMLQEG
jgi:DnaD/phage-associated family protein